MNKKKTKKRKKGNEPNKDATPHKEEKEKEIEKKNTEFKKTAETKNNINQTSWTSIDLRVTELVGKVTDSQVARSITQQT